MEPGRPPEEGRFDIDLRGMGVRDMIWMMIKRNHPSCTARPSSAA